MHPDSSFFIEFPPGPLAFGNRYVDNSEATHLQTQYGVIRIITPTQCVMDRIAWYVHGNDLQSRDQAVLVARRNEIDWRAVKDWAQAEGINLESIESIQADSHMQ